MVLFLSSCCTLILRSFVVVVLYTLSLVGV